MAKEGEHKTPPQRYYKDITFGDSNSAGTILTRPDIIRHQAHVHWSQSSGYKMQVHVHHLPLSQ